MKRSKLDIGFCLAIIVPGILGVILILVGLQWL